jgi:hypothetical protein
MAYTSADYNAENAADAMRSDKRTPLQRKWDNHEFALDRILYDLNRLKRGHGWTRKEGAIEALRNLALDFNRETQALAIDGYREGDPVSGIPALSPITTKVAQVGGAK